MFKRWCVALLISATPVAAQDVRLISDVVRDELSDASLLRELDDTAAPQDYVAAARADYRRLLTALYAAGYYAGEISITVDGVEAANIAPLAAPNTIGEVVIRVDPGRRFTFGTVQIAPLPPQTILPEDVGPRRTARSARIQSAVSSSLSSWRDLGYAKARVGNESIIARHADAKLDVDVTLDTGPRLRFGDLTISGNENVSDARIRQIAGLPTGEVYSPSELEAAERRLRRTGTFASVALTESDTIGADDTLPINAQLSEIRPRRFGFGLELSSIEGLTVSSFWLHRNFLGGAERFRVDGEVSGITGETGGVDYSLGATFTRPASFGPDTEYYLTGEISREDEPEYLLDKIALETGFSRILSDDLTVRAGVGILRAREETELETREYTLLTLPIEATLDRRDEPTNASNGYYIDLDATPFISTDGDISGARLFGDARGYVTVGEQEALTFAARVQVGSVMGADISQAPADFLFYSGGGGTVRGQPYQSLGIDTTEAGETVTTGGTSFLGAQLEARYSVRDNIALVGFYDVGQVGATAVPGEDAEWHAGAGFGLRYDTGIGPIRVDLGTQASGDDAGDDLQVYIGIGQAF
ncbi:autotransporter secretion outer membrane protein TamA [Yoonia maricola]|uniref:Autotransporter secretion outer membrane protein TamA n=1 Tax=Yoonia maricola TaxID=420999 RepID=A0A2M8W159_9RHOB|nr:BamA/TamA family outer membrane protein [Yoonia maricola]PJI84646.1 autotransporter secretion outer membrane protein TamA [Yoonia maricola]